MACVRTKKCRRESNVIVGRNRRTSIRLYYSSKIRGKFSVTSHIVRVAEHVAKLEFIVLRNSENPTVPQLFNKFAAFHETRRFITAFTRAHNALLS
jgi:hypothetical protein